MLIGGAFSCLVLYSSRSSSGYGFHRSDFLVAESAKGDVSHPVQLDAYMVAIFIRKRTWNFCLAFDLGARSCMG